MFSRVCSFQEQMVDIDLQTRKCDKLSETHALYGIDNLNQLVPQGTNLELKLRTTFYGDAGTLLQLQVSSLFKVNI